MMRVVVCAVVGLLSSSPNLCPKQPLQLRIPRHAPQRSRHVNAAAALRRSSPALKRQAKRLALLADPDEPIAEEVAGLRLLGLLGGGAFGKLSDAVGPLMGLFFGFQLATVLAFQSGSAGDRIREAGWRANDVSMRAYARLKREVEERGYVDRVRALYSKAIRWDAEQGESLLWSDIKAVGGWFRRQGQRAKAFADNRGITARAQRLWIATGLPSRLEEWRQGMILRARIDDVKGRERFNSPDGYGPQSP